DPRPHISIAWAAGDISQSLKRAVEGEVKKYINVAGSSTRWDVEVQEVPAPMGRDRAKKKDHHRCLDIQSENSNLQREYEDEQREKELDLQQKMFEFQQQTKFEEDLKYYNEDHDHLTWQEKAQKE
ncbi:hypothetical protein Tco_0735569, partial [Tanacetum coccineum]